ncbi:MAG: phage major capsid protein, partial [Actinophytocola sp.]|nr:phage major capsid protein [Actinophytocola sp.]
MKMLTKDEKLAPEPDARTLGQLGVLAKSLVGDVDERELSTFMPTGFKDMLSSGSAGVIVPTPIAGFVIDRLRNASVVNRLGARTVPMTSKTLKVPRITADPTAAWLAEGATITPNDGAMDNDVTMTAKRLSAIVKFSDELDEDSDPELAGEVLANSLARAFALELDRAALRGSGTGAEPLGVRNQSGVQILDLGANGADAD